MKRSPAPMRSRAERTSSTASISSSDWSTVLCIRSVSGSRGRWKPGRSASTSWWSGPLAIPITRRRVVCGLSETIATFPPASALTSVDLPTFGRPATATNPLLNDPHPHPGWGRMPAALGGDDSRRGRTLLSRVRAECGTSRAATGRRCRGSVELPRVRQQLGRRVAHDVALAIPEGDPIEPELVQPLAAASAGRGGDPDRLEVAGPAARHDRTRDRHLLGADAERVRGVLDV